MYRSILSGARQLRGSLQFAIPLFCRVHRPLFFAVLFCATVLSFLPAALVLTGRHLINGLVPGGTAIAGGSSSTWQAWLILAYLLAILGAVLRSVFEYSTARFGEKLEESLVCTIMDHASKLKFSCFSDPSFFNRFSLVNDRSGEHLLLFATHGMTVLTGAIKLATLAAVLITVDPLLIVLLLPVCIPYTCVHIWLSRLRFETEQEQVENRRRVGYYVGKLTTGDEIPEVRLLGLAPLFLQRVRDLMKEAHRSRRRIHRLVLAGTLFFTAILVTCVYGILYKISTGVVAQDLSVGDVALFIGATAALQMTVDTTIRSAGIVRWKILYVDALRDFMATETELEDDPSTADIVQQAEIQIEDLRFTFPRSDEPTLKGLSLHIRAGETVAIVGENGAGKTTLIKLLARFYEPDSGTIKIDGSPLSQIPHVQLYQKIALVRQTIGTWEATVHENLAYADWSTLLNNQERVEEIAQRVHLNETIEALPNDYQTHLGLQFGDHTLSGGQWQQLAIARAFGRNAPLLILDEPTSNLDPESERRIFAQFRDLCENRTTILVSHRLSTVRLADRILVMEDGRVVEDGTHDRLLDAEGKYARLYRRYRRNLLIESK